MMDFETRNLGHAHTACDAEQEDQGVAFGKRTALEAEIDAAKGVARANALSRLLSHPSCSL